MSDDSEYEDAREEEQEEDVNEDSPPHPVIPPIMREMPPEEGHNLVRLDNNDGLLQMEQHNEQDPPAPQNEEQVAPPAPPPQGLVHAHDIVRQVIDNLWPMLGAPRPVGQNLDDDVDDDGMENVEDGYFDEEENGEQQNDSDDNLPPSPLNENDNPEVVPPAEFDLQLPARHSYLGDGMEELQGRVVFDDCGPTPEIPLIVMALQLVPGQTLPLTIFHAVFQNAIRRCVLTNKVFGIVHNEMDSTSGGMVYKGAFGTIAEIYEFQEENEPPNETVGLTTFALKAKGRQRFNVVSFRRQADGNLMGVVKIRPEITLSPLVRAAMFDQTHRFRFPIKRRRQDNDDVIMDEYNEPTTRKLAKTLSISSTGSMPKEDQDAIVEADLARMQEKIADQRRITKFYSAFTPFPYFVYEQFDESVLVERVHRKLRIELKGLTESSHTNIPKDATELSFWLAQNLPMDDHHRLRILKMDSPVQRLRYELELLSRACKVIACRNCQTAIAESTDIFSMSVEGPQGTYVNPQGFVHETLTVHKASKDVILRGHSSTEASWFPGYSWTIAECRRCVSHLGWKFKAVGRLKPQKFWGLSRRSVSFKYNFVTDWAAAEDEELNSN